MGPLSFSIILFGERKYEWLLFKPLIRYKKDMSVLSQLHVKSWETKANYGKLIG